MHVRRALLLAPVALALSCAKTSDSAPPPAAPASDAATLTAQDCEAQGGAVVGDIGDGAIHKPGYRCPDTGAAPLGRISSEPVEDGPIATEGAVCCPGAAPA